MYTMYNTLRLIVLDASNFNVKLAYIILCLFDMCSPIAYSNNWHRSILFSYLRIGYRNGKLYWTCFGYLVYILALSW